MTDMSPLSRRIDELAEKREKATAGEWVVRPHDFDDWGMVRAKFDGERPWTVALARAGRFTFEDELNEHRKNGTDPYEANAAFIAAAANDAVPLLLECQEQIADLSEKLEKAIRLCAECGKGFLDSDWASERETLEARLVEAETLLRMFAGECYSGQHRLAAYFEKGKP